MKISQYLQIHKQMKILRIKADITQKVMAAKLELSVPTYSNYENGYSEPSMEVIQKSCTVLGISEDAFFGYVISHNECLEEGERIRVEMDRNQIVDTIVKDLFHAELLNEAEYPSAAELQEECRDIILKGLRDYHILKGDVY